MISKVNFHLRYLGYSRGKGEGVPGKPIGKICHSLGIIGIGDNDAHELSPEKWLVENRAHKFRQ